MNDDITYILCWRGVKFATWHQETSSKLEFTALEDSSLICHICIAAGTKDLLLFAFIFFFFFVIETLLRYDYDWFSIYAGVHRGEKEEESHFPSIHPGVEKDWPLALHSAIKAAAVSWPAPLRLACHVCLCDRPIKKMECVNGDGDGRSPPARSRGASHHLTS